MDSCEWKMTYNNPNHCSMMNLADTPTRPPWRPAASSITAFKESDSPAPRSTFRFRRRSTELAVPPQYVSVTDLIAAMPKRHRVPKPQTLCNSYGLAAEPYQERLTLKTPNTAPGYDSLGEDLETDKLDKRSSEQTPKSGLEQAAKSVASSRSRQHSEYPGSQLASPPSGARSVASSASPSRAPSVVSSNRHPSRHSAITSPVFSTSQPTSPQRRTGASSDCASPASRARSMASPSVRSQYSSSAGQITSRTPGTNSGLVSANDRSSFSHGSTNARTSRSSRCNNNTHGGSGKDYPSRGTTGRSTPRSAHSRSSCGSGHSTPSYRSVRGKSPPLSGRCSPPTPPMPLSP